MITDCMPASDTEQNSLQICNNLHVGYVWYRVVQPAKPTKDVLDSQDRITKKTEASQTEFVLSLTSV